MADIQVGLVGVHLLELAPWFVAATSLDQDNLEWLAMLDGLARVYRVLYVDACDLQYEWVQHSRYVFVYEQALVWFHD